MAFCLQCKKWVNQSAGKRAKQFCNNTCRSNYWYSKNKKGQVKLAAPQEHYDAPPLPPNFKGDEPLCFDTSRREATVINAYDTYIERLRAAESLEELETIGREIERSTLSSMEKKRLHAFGQQIANEKFNF